MLFYKVEGIIANFPSKQDDSRRAYREHVRKLSVKSDDFNQKYCKNSFYFISDCSDGVMTIGVVSDRSETLKETLNTYINYIEIELKDLVVAEITINRIENLLSTAYRQDYISDDDEILERYGLDKITGRCGRGITYGENIIEEHSKKDIFDSAEKYLLHNTFLPELHRIYSGSSPGKSYGHPVHYMLQTDDRDTRRETYKLLLQALYANHRLNSKRYCFLDFKPGENFSVMAYDTLYNVCDGGAVIIRYLANDDSEDNIFANSERDTIESLCEVAKRYRNQVLTVICLPRECKSAKALFYENLGTMTIVEIQEEFVSDERAVSFLKMLAKESHVRTDKTLFSELEAGKGYLAPDLHAIFDEWYNCKLKTSIYPQYKDIALAKREVIKAAPKGNAYDELQEMVGLSGAKAVIQKALNYYKMQQLYEEKGFKKDIPAMHMVFTGNPGTAKTTVARLFARIMKDNGLLSKGQLIEVGRGDLVGKYVGWTAQTVQAKFKAAVGGILFIDEAYSLVDECSGSFGDEAINTIVQEMENHREDVVVIFAGYPDKMEVFLQKNPGLRSRIAFHVPFADYTTDELCKIALLIGKGKGVTLDAEAMSKLKVIFSSAGKQSDFGNGRYVRNILEQAKMNQASRLLNMDFDKITSDEISTIRAVDIIIPECQAPQERKIGFAC